MFPQCVNSLPEKEKTERFRKRRISLFLQLFLTQIMAIPIPFIDVHPTKSRSSTEKPLALMLSSGWTMAVNKAKQLFWRSRNSTQTGQVDTEVCVGTVKVVQKKTPGLYMNNCSIIMFCEGPLILIIVSSQTVSDQGRYKRTYGPTAYLVGHSRDSGIAAAHIVMNLHVWRTVVSQCKPLKLA